MFLDLTQAFAELEGTPHEDRLEQLLRIAGCEFYEPGLLKTPTVKVLNIGGLPVTSTAPLRIADMPMNTEHVKNGFNITRGLGGCITYLNPKNNTPEEMTGIQTAHSHFSTAHLCTVGVGVFGLTTAAEHEFDCQRDLLQLGRITNARTAAQNKPPLVVLLPEHLEACRKVRQMTAEILSQIVGAKQRSLESRNSLWPKNSATAILLSGTLRNWQKIVAQQDDAGKEDEYRLLLQRIEAVLQVFAPDMFRPDK